MIITAVHGRDAGGLLLPATSRDQVNILSWIGSGAAGESDRRVGLNCTGNMAPDIIPGLTSNPKPKLDCVVWAK